MLCLGQFDVAKCISWVFAYNMKARRGLLLTVFLLVPQYYKRYWITMEEVLNGSPIQHFLQAKKHCLRFAYCLFLFLTSDQSGKICNPFCFSQYIIRNSHFIEKYYCPINILNTLT